MLAQIGSTLDISKGRFLKNKMEGKMEEYKLFYFYFASFVHFQMSFFAIFCLDFDS